MSQTKGLCDECAKLEVQQANWCLDREIEAQAKGERYLCECPIIRCGHDSSVPQTSDAKEKP